MKINDFVREVLSQYCIGFITGLNERTENELTRIFGYHYDEPTAILSLFANKEDASKVISCFNHTNKIACVLTDVISFKTIQFKGECELYRDATPEEYKLIETKFRVKAREVFKIMGISENNVDYWMYQPGISLQVKCTEVFDQTPKQNTGTKICQA